MSAKQFTTIWYYFVNTPIFEIEQEIGIPMPEFGKLPISVQYILIRQNRQIADYYAQIEDIREHLDRTPI